MQKEISSDKDNSLSALRIKAGMLIIAAVIFSATLISLFSQSQSKESILGIFGMAFSVVLLVLFLVVKQPVPERKGWFHMDNPVVALGVSMSVEFFGFMLYIIARKLFP